MYKTMDTVVQRCSPHVHFRESHHSCKTAPCYPGVRLTSRTGLSAAARLRADRERARESELEANEFWSR